jgi:GldM N-terminal domain
MLPFLNTLIKRTWMVVLLMSVMVLNACKDSDKNSSLIFEELNESLERSNRAIEASSTTYLMALSGKQKRAETAERARIWGGLADSIHSKTKNLINFIDSLKLKVKNENFKINDESIGKLFTKLKGHREFVLNQHERIKKEFEKIIIVANSDFNTRFSNKEDFVKTNFSSSLTSKNISALLKFENDVMTTENEIVAYCYHQVPNNYDGYDKFSPIAFQNSTHFKSGEELIISVGMGSLTLRNLPMFTINGIKVNANDEGIGVYKMKVEEKKGRYKIPVTIEFFNQDGRKVLYSKFLEYTVDK